MFGLFKKFRNAVNTEFNRQINGTEYHIRKIQDKGRVDMNDFRELMHCCPPLIVMLRKYLLNASVQEIGNMVKKGQLHPDVVVNLYNKLNLKKKEIC